MPSAKRYKKGSIVYFEGERKDRNVFLLKQGGCQREKIDYETMLPKKTRINEGEFFGIKAAMGVPARDETVSCYTDSLVYIFNPKEFEAIISKNVTIILKMMKNFSNELRRIHYGIEKMIGKSGAGSGIEDIATNLYETAFFYFEKGSFDIAMYGFKKFLEQHPEDSRKAEVKEFLEKMHEIKNKKTPKDEKHVSESTETENPEASQTLKLFEQPESLDASNDTDKEDGKKLNHVLNLYKKSEFQEARKALTAITDSLPAPPPESPFYEKIFLTDARLDFYTKNYNSAVEKAKKFASLYQNSPFLTDALICIGESYRNAGSTDNAKAIYKKILSGSLGEKQKQDIERHYNQIWSD